LKYTLFTDGSARPNPGPAGWAYLIAETGIGNFGSMKYATNNEAEMTAVLYGLGGIPDGSEVCVVSDSKLVIGWLCKKWKTKANPAIAGLRWAIFELVKNKRLVVTFKKTEGHASDQYNNLVDRLAYQASCNARDLSTSKDVPRLRLILDVDGLDMEAADYILSAIEKAGGVAQGTIEEIDAALEVVKTRTIDNNK
jgi:ribonuclease HI